MQVFVPIEYHLALAVSRVAAPTTNFKVRATELGITFGSRTLKEAIFQ